VLKELALIDSSVRAHMPRYEELATNALERALLFCARANFRGGDPRWNPRIQQAADYLAENLHEKHLVKNVARRFGFSETHFAALFRRQMGQPPGQYLETRRLVQARQLLTCTNQTLAQIADRIGFSSPFYLSQRFKSHFGYSPRILRQQK
jgi:AraC-like DNA-binding protein